MCVMLLRQGRVGFHVLLTPISRLSVKVKDCVLVIVVSVLPPCVTAAEHVIGVLSSQALQI